MTFNIPAATDFAEGDRYALRVTQSNNADAGRPVGDAAVHPYRYLMTYIDVLLSHASDPPTLLMLAMAADCNSI